VHTHTCVRLTGAHILRKRCVQKVCFSNHLTGTNESLHVHLSIEFADSKSPKDKISTDEVTRAIKNISRSLEKQFPS
jgi:hypothetical protein